MFRSSPWDGLAQGWRNSPIRAYLGSTTILSGYKSETRNNSEIVKQK